MFEQYLSSQLPDSDLSSQLPEKFSSEYLFKIKKGLIDTLKKYGSLDVFYQNYIKENELKDITLIGNAITETYRNDRCCLYLLDLVIKMGVNMNYCNPDGMTGLFYAVLYSNILSIRFLLQNHIDDTIQDNYGNTALICACAFPLHGNYEMVDILSNNPRTINMANKEGITPFLSMSFLDERIIYLLSSKGANVQDTDINGNNALHLAIVSKKTKQRANENVLLKLLSLGIDINAKNNAGETPLFLAFKYYEYDKAKVLAQNNADFSIENNKGESVFSISKGSMYAQGILDNYSYRKNIKRKYEK